MSASAIVMLIVGAVLLWGGVAVAVVNYVRMSRREDG